MSFVKSSNNIRSVTEEIRRTAHYPDVEPQDGDLLMYSAVEEAFLPVAAGELDTRPYKVYSGLFLQNGTNAPVVTVLENTLGFNVTWKRNSLGSYSTNESFDIQKTLILLNAGNWEEFFLNAVGGIEEDTNPIFIRTFDITASGLVDSSFGTYPLHIEIRVYP